MPLTHAQFARSIAYLSKVASAWAGDNLSLDATDVPVDPEVVSRFCAEIRELLAYIESRAQPLDEASP